MALILPYPRWFLFLLSLRPMPPTRQMVSHLNQLVILSASKDWAGSHLTHHLQMLAQWNLAKARGASAPFGMHSTHDPTTAPWEAVELSSWLELGATRRPSAKVCSEALQRSAASESHLYTPFELTDDPFELPGTSFLSSKIWPLH